MTGSRNGPRWSASQVLGWIISQKPLKLEDGEWTSDMGPTIKPAQEKLTKVLASGHVQAWGRTEPHGLLEEIPRDPFTIRRFPAVVGVYGDMGSLYPHIPYNGPRWSSIEFDADQI